MLVDPGVGARRGTGRVGVVDLESLRSLSLAFVLSPRALSGLRGGRCELCVLPHPWFLTTKGAEACRLSHRLEFRVAVPWHLNLRALSGVRGGCEHFCATPSGSSQPEGLSFVAFLDRSGSSDALGEFANGCDRVESGFVVRDGVGIALFVTFHCSLTCNLVDAWVILETDLGGPLASP